MAARIGVLGSEVGKAARDDYIALVRPGEGQFRIVKNHNDGTFASVFQPGKGVGGYDLSSTADRGFAFDYNHSGHRDFLVLYRPGAGRVAILRNQRDGSDFTAVYNQDNGIGGFDLKDGADHGLAFDYNSSGKQDHLVFYRPGAGTIAVIGNNNGVFSAKYNGSGIGGYDLTNKVDRICALDFNSSGKNDHLVLYRPGEGRLAVVRPVNGQFLNVFQEFGGVAGYDLNSSNDWAFALDYNCSGRQDHLVLYRPGSGKFCILRAYNRQFLSVYNQDNGIGGFDFKNKNDRAFAFDYNHTGRLDHIVVYRPGTGRIVILKNNNGQWQAKYSSDNGIGGFDLKSEADRAIAFDFTSAY